MLKSPEQSNESNKDSWIAEHNSLVESGGFDAIPIRPIKVGDMVAIRENNLIHQVFEVRDNEAVVGYDLDGKRVRKLFR